MKHDKTPNKQRKKICMLGKKVFTFFQKKSWIIYPDKKFSLCNIGVIINLCKITTLDIILHSFLQTVEYVQEQNINCSYVGILL